MTPRTSTRAYAREVYCASAEKEGLAQPADCAGESKDTDLMTRVRGLYEDSAVPVREIARLAGVTERTIYKYAQKHFWQPRYRWHDDHPCMRARGWRTADRFAPTKGAGGRFIRREDAGKPYARGLKANDPAGRARAVTACAEAERLAREAQQKAEHERLVRENWSAFRAADRALEELGRYRDKHPPNRRDREVETALLEAWQYALEATRCARLAREQFEATMK